MINKIIDGICEAIFNEFGEGCNIETKSLKQGLKEPCFFVFCINPTSSQFLKNKYFRTNQMGIQYFPATKDKNSECNDVIERLNDCLEVISVNGDLTRGTKMHGEIIDEVLNYFINYDTFVYKVVPPTDAMGTMKVDSGAKG